MAECDAHPYLGHHQGRRQMNLTLEQRVEALEQNMKMLLGVEPLYKSKNNVHIDQERLNGIVREMRSEPLIKDKKVRKAVRAWAEANLIERAKFEYVKGTGSVFANGNYGAKITFYGDLRLTNRITYEIDDLCGEEEE